MPVLITLGRKCSTLAASRAAPPTLSRIEYAPSALLRLGKKTGQTDGETDIQTDGRTPDRYIACSARRGQRKKL